MIGLNLFGRGKIKDDGLKESYLLV